MMVGIVGDEPFQVFKVLLQSLLGFTTSSTSHTVGLLELVDRLALPDFLHLVRKNSRSWSFEIGSS